MHSLFSIENTYIYNIFNKIWYMCIYIMCTKLKLLQLKIFDLKA